MFGRGVYENSRPGGLALLQVIDPEGEEPPDRRPQLFVPLKRSELRGEVCGPLAALRLTHVYGYSREQCDRALEAVYRFPLPGDAAVTAVKVRFGEVEIHTRLQAREEAEAEYKEAVEAGKQAALLTRESADVFTLRVSGLRPDEEVQVETQYVQLARPQGETPTWSLRLPLATAPRYVREDEAGSRYAQGQPLALLRDPGHRFALDLGFREAGEVSSPTHALDVTEEPAGEGMQRVRLAEGEVLPDRDLVLLWSPRQQADRPTLSLLAHHEAEWLYFLALVAPPARHEPGSGVPREAVLLVDHSGSMNGAKWAATDWAVNRFLMGLTEHDYFDLGLFHNTCKWYAPAPHRATEEERQRACRYLDENRDSGGTNLGVALEQALRLPRPKGGERGRHVLVVTDAQVSDAGRIFRLADGEARHPQRRRISVLCIDAAPNSFLAHELAERGGGLARFLTSDPDQGDVTTALEDVLADWGEPVLTGLRLKVDRGGGQAAGRETSTKGHKTTIDLGDLPHGRAVWVAGRVPAGAGETLSFELSTPTTDVASYSVVAEDTGGDRSAIVALFGARRVLGLEYLMHAGLQGKELARQLERLGYSTDDLKESGPDAVYAENARREASQALKGLLIREALAYGLASAETAFVAVRSEAGEPISGSVVVPGALPSGWSDGFLSVARAAAPMGPLSLAAAPNVSAARPKGRRAGRLEQRIPARPRANRPRHLRDAAYSLAAPGETPRSARRGAGGGRPVAQYTGRPGLDKGQVVLIEQTVERETTLSQIAVEVNVDPAQLDRELALWVYVQDLAMPRARIRLADLMRLGGRRPLNLRVPAGAVVRVALVDPSGAWKTEAPTISLRITS